MNSFDLFSSKKLTKNCSQMSHFFVQDLWISSETNLDFGKSLAFQRFAHNFCFLIQSFCTIIFDRFSSVKSRVIQQVPQTLTIYYGYLYKKILERPLRTLRGRYRKVYLGRNDQRSLYLSQRGGF